jgi:hypothetical protein
VGFLGVLTFFSFSLIFHERRAMEPERKLKVRQRSKLFMSRLFFPFSVKEERQ